MTRRGRARSFPDESEWSATRSEVAFATLQFASCFAYSPGGDGRVCEEGRLLCARLKAADEAWLPWLAARVWSQTVGCGRFAAAFGERVVLVPVPGSTPGQRGCWVGERLAWCLREIGLAAQVWPVLRRRRGVRKSAFAPAGERPSVLEHFESFAIESGRWDATPARGADPGRAGCFVAEPGECRLRLTLVDDVITRGRTLLGAAGRLREAFPGAQVQAFALLRTLARDEALRRILDPCEGEVRWIGRDARRMP